MAEEAAVVVAVAISAEDVAAEVAVTEAEVVAERAMHSRRVNAPEAVDADFPTRVEEEAEVRISGPSSGTFHNEVFLKKTAMLRFSNTDSIISLSHTGGGRGGRGGGDRGSSGGGGGVCYANQKGECTRGSSCRFTH